MAARHWVSATPSDFNNTAAWSTTSGGAGGASVPGPTDDAIFSSGGLGQCSITDARQVGGCSLQSGFTGTLAVEIGGSLQCSTMTYNSGSISQSGAITVTLTLIVSAGPATGTWDLVPAASPTLTIGPNFEFTNLSSIGNPVLNWENTDLTSLLDNGNLITVDMVGLNNLTFLPGGAESGQRIYPAGATINSGISPLNISGTQGRIGPGHPGNGTINGTINGTADHMIVQTIGAKRLRPSEPTITSALNNVAFVARGRSISAKYPASGSLAVNIVNDLRFEMANAGHCIFTFGGAIICDDISFDSPGPSKTIEINQNGHDIIVNGDWSEASQFQPHNYIWRTKGAWITVNGNMDFSDPGSQSTFYLDSSRVVIKGNMTSTKGETFVYGAGYELILDGTSDQIIDTGGSLLARYIYIDKPSGDVVFSTDVEANGLVIEQQPQKLRFFSGAVFDVDYVYCDTSPGAGDITMQASAPGNKWTWNHAEALEMFNLQIGDCLTDKTINIADASNTDLGGNSIYVTNDPESLLGLGEPSAGRLVAMQFFDSVAGFWRNVPCSTDITFTVQTESVDVTTRCSGGSRELLEDAGTRSMTASLSGYIDAVLSYEEFMQLPGKAVPWRFYSGTGDTYTGTFEMVSFERTGSHNGAEMWTASLESSGHVEFESGALGIDPNISRPIEQYDISINDGLDAHITLSEVSTLTDPSSVNSATLYADGLDYAFVQYTWNSPGGPFGTELKNFGETVPGGSFLPLLQGSADQRYGVNQGMPDGRVARLVYGNRIYGNHKPGNDAWYLWSEGAVSLWFAFSSLGPQGANGVWLMHETETGTGFGHLRLGFDFVNNLIDFSIGGPSSVTSRNDQILNVAAPFDDRMHHFVITWGDSLQVYLDGRLIRSQMATVDAEDIVKLALLGTYNPSALGNTPSVLRWIDQIRLYDWHLTKDHVALLNQEPFPRGNLNGLLQ